MLAAYTRAGAAQAARALDCWVSYDGTRHGKQRPLPTHAAGGAGPSTSAAAGGSGPGSGRPLLCVLYQEPKGARNVKTYEVALGAKVRPYNPVRHLNLAKQLVSGTHRRRQSATRAKQTPGTCSRLEPGVTFRLVVQI